jgi:uncharacterized Tic20 family protein
MNDIVTATPSKDDCNIAMLAHLLGIFTSFVGALIIWLFKKDDSPFVGAEAVEALNFQITIALGWIVASMLTLILVGFLMFPLLVLANLILCIVAAVSASKGKHYRYPLTLRLVK